MENPYTIKQVVTDSNLLQAWYKVRANDGCAGIDRETTRYVPRLTSHNDVLFAFIYDPLEQVLPDAGRLALHQLCTARKRRPTAVVVANMHAALGALEGAREIGLKVPDDVALLHRFADRNTGVDGAAASP